MAALKIVVILLMLDSALNWNICKNKVDPDEYDDYNEKKFCEINPYAVEQPDLLQEFNYERFTMNTDPPINRKNWKTWAKPKVNLIGKRDILNQVSIGTISLLSSSTESSLNYKYEYDNTAKRDSQKKMKKKLKKSNRKLSDMDYNPFSGSMPKDFNLFKQQFKHLEEVAYWMLADLDAVVENLDKVEPEKTTTKKFDSVNDPVFNKNNIPSGNIEKRDLSQDVSLETIDYPNQITKQISKEMKSSTFNKSYVPSRISVNKDLSDDFSEKRVEYPDVITLITGKRDRNQDESKNLKDTGKKDLFQNASEEHLHYPDLITLRYAKGLNQDESKNLKESGKINLSQDISDQRVEYFDNIATRTVKPDQDLDKSKKPFPFQKLKKSKKGFSEAIIRCKEESKKK